ncbi:hypothetical protein SKAU_G00301970 [Synaphobranchus kaupii]|uniref:Uncharacterized protein n=1 Tax=Synaphobranchus kaupii TaxID=118154 RepID=A0A9Q1IN44_SYNKA|nr:hypothetical protein SKAU_G00301970 [Synaphobranchus kaupii]
MLVPQGPGAWRKLQISHRRQREKDRRPATRPFGVRLKSRVPFKTAPTAGPSGVDRVALQEQGRRGLGERTGSRVRGVRVYAQTKAHHLTIIIFKHQPGQNKGYHSNTRIQPYLKLQWTLFDVNSYSRKMCGHSGQLVTSVHSL